MTEFHFPWLATAILTPLVGIIFILRERNPDRAWFRSVLVCGATLAITTCGWLDFHSLRAAKVVDPLLFIGAQNSDSPFVIDRINSPLLPLAAMLFFFVTLTTVRTKIRRFPYVWNLVLLSLTLALLSCSSLWGIVALSILQAVPPWMELRSRRRSTRVFLLHMSIFATLLVLAASLISFQQRGEPASPMAVCLLAAAILIRSGAAPLHCWVTDLFDKAGFGTALLFVTPMSGAYIAVRLLLPVAPEWALRSVAMVSLGTAIYSAGMSLIQPDTRRFFAYLFLSNASLVLVGFELASAVSLTSALALWLSAGIALAGLGLTLRAVEARCGRLSLADYHGLYDHMPTLAVFYLLTALASIGFPGTIGFVGAELLVESLVNITPLAGMFIVFVGALNGIAVMRVYFRLFTGTLHTSSVALDARWREKLAVLSMTALILGGGLLPQLGMTSRYNAATEILSSRATTTAVVERAAQIQTNQRHDHF